ncbi:MAG: hypothetical protein ACP5UZ_00445 [Thermoplasmata archaeon]
MLRDRVLDLLFKEEITQKELTSRLNSSRSRMSEVLRNLEEQHIITRKRVSQRTVLVSLNHSRTLRVGILRSSEYFHIVSALEHLGKKIPFRLTVYDNSLEALRELMTGAEDMVASPLISGYFFYLIDRNIRPIAGVAEGGSGLIRRRTAGKIGTTPLSRMDRDSRDINGYEQVYFKSIDDILRAYNKREIDAAQIWEPFLTMNHGIRNETDGLCCCIFTRGREGHSINSFLSTYKKEVGEPLGDDEKREISRVMARILKVGQEDVIKSLKSYHFTTVINKSDLEKQIESFGLPIVKEVDSFLERTTKVPL